MARGVKRQRAVFSWLFVCALFVLCVVLGILQYRWITEVSLTARDRLREGLQRSLMRLGQDFDSEIAFSCAALTPSDPEGDPQLLQNEVAERYTQWKKTNRHDHMFNRIALAIPQGNSIELRSLDLDRGVLQTVDWPAGWDAMKSRLEANLYPGDRSGRGRDPGSDHQPPRWPPPRPGARGGGSRWNGDGLVFEEPLFSTFDHSRRGPSDNREIGWLIFELNLAYLRDVMLPGMLQRDLGANGGLDYQVEVVAKNDPASIIYQSGLDSSQDIAATADASITFFEPQNMPGSRRGGNGPPSVHGPGSGPGGRGDHGPGPGPAPDGGRWRMYVRHRAGSLEAVVAQSRLRSLAVTGGVLLLILATAAALLRYTRRAQTLADLQMEFVAGVSHELRTPLTVIHTAAYNLQGKMATNPAQVEKYGALIQRESGRLGDLVEQVLQFASAHSGRVLQEREPLSVESVIDETIEAHKDVIDGCHCVVVKSVDPGLPPVLGDARALGQVIGNLLCNAAKYGVYGSGDALSQGNWIGIFASKAAGDHPASIEIRVSDRGPGIPADEQEHIFDPFFRGSRAVQDQIHGTGLGLSLVKKIVEAHGGSIRVKSEPMKGAEFILWLPAAPAGAVG